MHVLPLNPDRVFCDVSVRRQNDETVCNCLANQNPVKRVLMVFGQAGKLQHRSFIELQGIDGVKAPPFLDKFVRRLRQGQFAEVVFDQDFPCGDNAQKNIIVRVGVQTARGVRQLRTA